MSLQKPALLSVSAAISSPSRLEPLCVGWTTGKSLRLPGPVFALGTEGAALEDEAARPLGPARAEANGPIGKSTRGKP
eukprot:4340536-Amphidinium_carterae.1